MSKKITPRIIGTGYAVPRQIRTNNDPIFDWIKKNLATSDDMFAGYDIRHVLSDSEGLIDIMIPACEKALNNAHKTVEDVDLLLGVGSVSQYANPNVLSDLHFKLGLPDRCWAVPQSNVYSNFNAAIYFADALIQAGRVDTVLICVAGNWTKNVDYHTMQAISAADGAGAAVMAASSDTSKFKLVDSVTISDTQYYGALFTGRMEYKLQAPIPSFVDNNSLYSKNFVHITDKGKVGFKEFGEGRAIHSVVSLLKKNGLKASDITLFPNQSSSVLLDAWQEVISNKEAQYIQTLKLFANMTVATYPVNLAYAEEKDLIEKDHIVIMALGPDMHVNSLLFKRC